MDRPAEPIPAPEALVKTFRYWFGNMTGVAPFAWQEELFATFLRGEIPERIDLPTGAGKTSVMTIWLFALATQLDRGATISLPRRLA